MLIKVLGVEHEETHLEFSKTLVEKHFVQEFELGPEHFAQLE
jgi:hypothetical protein